MVVRSGRYFGLPLKEYHGMTQGNPLSPTLFNMAVDTVICHWVTVVALTEDGMEGLGLSILYSAAYFYANYGIFTSTQQERLQRAFDILIVLFGRVGLMTNTRKTVSMACQTCHTPGRMSLES